jgi:hypothetical protein
VLAAAALLLVVLPLGSSPSGGDERVATEDGRHERELDRADTSTTGEPSPTTTVVGSEVPGPQPDPGPADAAPSTTTPTTAPPAPAGPAPEPPSEAHWSATPSSGPPGTVITVSGTGCTEHSAMAWLSNTTERAGFNPTGPSVEAPTDARGTWTIRLTVPPEARNVDVNDQAGSPEWLVHAGCFAGVAGPTFFYEPELGFDVTGPVFVPPRMTFSTREVHPGGSVSVSGDECPADVVRVDVFSNLDTFTTKFVPVRHDSWHTTITVPPDYDPGYALVFYAKCGTVFDYAPAPEVVDVTP